MYKMATRSKVQKRICLAYVILMGPAFLTCTHQNKYCDKKDNLSKSDLKKKNDLRHWPLLTPYILEMVKLHQILH
jgi:hypothetical protein